LHTGLPGYRFRADEKDADQCYPSNDWVFAMNTWFMRRSRAAMILGASLVAMASGASVRMPPQAGDAQAVDVSLVALIATPEKFDGRKVRVIGAVRLAFERSALYLHREHMDLHLPSNAVWLSFGPDGPTPTQRALSGGYVGIEGVFSTQFKGHWGKYAGSIREITRIEGWPPPEVQAITR
jgi:hypothetical protein